jgi:probable F420-dependent oxidoreductase
MDPRYINLGPLTTLAWIGAVTSRVRLQTRVLPLPIYSPFNLAKDAASVDYLTGGRLELGLGSGWMKEEFDVMNLPFASRGAMLDEGIGVMRALWTDAGAFEGPTFSFTETYAAPTPVQDPLPIWLVVSNSRTLKRAVALGNGLFVQGSTPDSRHYWDELARALDAAGRDPAGFHVSAEGSLKWDETADRPDAAATIESIDRWAQVGVDSLNVSLGIGYERPIEAFMERIEAVAEDILPAAHALKANKT